uniref:Candidate secreted effector n=1 Tax=Meloidogyne incognita TaxID=6306 RepID=A0A914NLT3_MELIC
MLAKILVAIVLLQLVLESVNAQEGNKYPVGPIDDFGAVTTDCPIHKKGGEHHKGHGKEKKEKKHKGTKKPKKPKKGGKTIPPNVEATTDGGEIVPN